MATATGGGVEVSLATVLTESQRIISAHSRHFLALTLIFLLLPCFSLSLLPSSSLLHRIQPPNSQAFLTLDRLNIGTDHVGLHVALFAAFLLCFSQLATGSITRSVIHGFYGRPVRFLPAAVSAIHAFPRLLLTSVLSLSLLLGFLLLSLSSLLLILRLIGLLIGSAAESSYVMLPVTALSLAVVFLAVHLKLSLLLSPVVTVAESTWGFHPLKRSRFLVSGVQLAALSVFLSFKLAAGLLLAAAAGAASFLSGDWAYVVVIVVTCASLMAVLLYEAAAHTVLYMYSKAARGELAGEIAEEIARDYVSLPFDDHKVPHVVSVVYNAV